MAFFFPNRYVRSSYRLRCTIIAIKLMNFYYLRPITQILSMYTITGIFLSELLVIEYTLSMSFVSTSQVADILHKPHHHRKEARARLGFALVLSYMHKVTLNNTIERLNVTD
jgi:hypothetical protein